MLQQTLDQTHAGQATVSRQPHLPPATCASYRTRMSRLRHDRLCLVMPPGITGQRGRIQSRAARKDAPTVKRGRVLVPRLIGQTARARDTKQPPAEAPPRGTVNRGGRERSGRAGRRGSRRGCTYRERLGRGVVSSSGRRHGPELSVVDSRGRFRAHERRTPPRRPGPVRKPAWRPPALEVRVKRMCRTPPYRTGRSSMPRSPAALRSDDRHAE